MAASIRVCSYGVVTWNAGGLHKGTDGGKQRGDWLLRQWDGDLSLGVKETENENDTELLILFFPRFSSPIEPTQSAAGLR